MQSINKKISLAESLLGTDKNINEIQARLKRDPNIKIIYSTPVKKKPVVTQALTVQSVKPPSTLKRKVYEAELDTHRALLIMAGYLDISPGKLLDTIAALIRKDQLKMRAELSLHLTQGY